MMQEIIDVLKPFRFPLSHEKRLQVALHNRLVEKFPEARREVRLSSSDIIDLMVGPVGVEVKIKGGKLDIYRQCERYCQHEAVEQLLLVTLVPMSLPNLIAGKPARVFNLARAWL